MALWLRNFRREILVGELGAWVRTTPSGKQLACEFCRRCGSRMFHQMTDQANTMSIKPGTLETALELEPVAHIWTSSARNWLRMPSSLLSYPENPPTFDEIFAAWHAQKSKAIVSTIEHR
jgi:hypothetical protein